jgi:hypothetical protein
LALSAPRLRVCSRYAIGIEQMESGEPKQAIITFTRAIAPKADFAEGRNSAQRFIS